MRSTAVMALMAVAMMVGMMLPSIAPTVWRHHRALRAMRAPRAVQRTALFVGGYAGVWAVIGLVLFAVSVTFSSADTAPSAKPPFTPLATGAVILFAGLFQRSRWKAQRLARCRDACVSEWITGRNVICAWRAGCCFGIDCSLSCCAAMAILVVSGLMDGRMMVVITAAITAERIAPGGARMARLTGTLAIVSGLLMSVQALRS